ncbi:MAG: secondary thiamine-phosphate synthase enzyme YjbQ [bacterium]
MKTYTEVSNLRSQKRIEIINVSSQVKQVVGRSGIKDGFILVYSLHTTTGLYVNQSERNLESDLEAFLEKIIPQQNNYKHNAIDNNADAHLRAIMLGNQVILPLTGGDPDLGVWQSVLFVELDGPRRRAFIIKIIGE